MDMKLEDYLKDAEVYVWQETFAIAKAKQTVQGAFANIVDKDEITVIIDQTKVNFKYTAIEKDWKILTLNVVFPMDVYGVTAKISGCLAKAKVSIMPIAAFSKDHYLINKDDLAKAVHALSKIGIETRYL